MEIVATIPYTPRRFLSPGYMLGPFTAYLIARHTGLRPLIAINSLGIKGYSQDDGDRFVQTYQRIVQHPVLVWRDDVQEREEVLSTWSTLGTERGWLCIENRELWRCSCGLVEFLPEPLNLVGEGFRHKAYSMENGKARCVICRTVAKSFFTDVLLMELPTDMPQTLLAPAYATSEWKNLGRQLNGRKLLVSRGRHTGLETTLQSRRFHIDVDVFSMLMPFFVSIKDIHVTTLICGHKTLKQALLASQLSRLMGIREPRMVVSVPYMNFDDESINGQSVDAILDTYDASTLRILYAMALGHSGKCIRLRSSLFETIKQALVRMEPLEEPALSSRDVDALYRGIGLDNLQKALSFIRRKQLDRLTPEMRAGLTLLLSSTPLQRNSS